MSEAVDFLAALEQQILQQGAPLPASSGAGSWQAVAFEQAGVPLLLNMSRVREVLPLPACTRLPGVKNWVVGIANVRGQILPLVDLGSYLDQAPSRNHPNQRVLVVRRQEMELGLLVDRVLGMKQVAGKAGSLEDAGLPVFLKPYCEGSCGVDGQDYGIFSVDRLLTSAAFKQIVVL